MLERTNGTNVHEFTFTVLENIRRIYWAVSVPVREENIKCWPPSGEELQPRFLKR